MYQLRLKILARDAHVPAIAVESGQIVLRPAWFKDLSNEQWHALRGLLQSHGRVGRREIWLPLTWEQLQWRDNLRETLALLAQWRGKP